jgi:putative transcriptional regulator
MRIAASYLACCDHGCPLGDQAARGEGPRAPEDGLQGIRAVRQRVGQRTVEDGAMSFAPLTGRLLVASPSMGDPNFDRTVVAVLEHHPDDGALGVVVNRPSGTDVAEVLPAISPLVAEPAVVFVGGPVQPQAALCLGVPRPGVEPDGFAPLASGVATVDLDKDPAVLTTGLQVLRVFAGYAGWGGGQLEAEIAAGAWFVVDGVPYDVFADDPEQLWRTVLRRQGGTLALVSTYPEDPRLN